jgi:hypothetical protein
MGATVSTARRVAAIHLPKGKTVYAIFEETYEKNCSPHTPSWCCVGIGELTGIVRRIFQLASSCEGGMLQNRSGHITPEGYLQSWFRELAEPFTLLDRPVLLRVGTGIYDSINTGKLDLAEEILAGIGRTDLMEALRTEKRANIQLFKDIDVVLALYGVDGGIYPPWTVIDRSGYLEGERNRSLGYNPSKASRDISEDAFPKVMRVGNDDCFLENANGSYRYGGWAYSVVQEFVRDFYAEELSKPGSYTGRIRRFRNHVESAPRILASGFRVLVDTSTPPAERWQQRNLEELKQGFPVTPSQGGFEVGLSAENFRLVTSLPKELVWLKLTAEAQAA